MNIDIDTLEPKVEINRPPSIAEVAWRKMISHIGERKYISKFMQVARIDGSITEDPGTFLLSTVNDDKRNPIVELYAYDGNVGVHVFRFNQDGSNHYVYRDKDKSFIDSIIETFPHECFYINYKVGYKWCNDIKSMCYE